MEVGGSVIPRAFRQGAVAIYGEKLGIGKGAIPFPAVLTLQADILAYYRVFQ